MSDEQNERPDLRVAFFEGQPIRREWVDDRWFFSVIDVVVRLPRVESRVLLGRPEVSPSRRGRR